MGLAQALPLRLDPELAARRHRVARIHRKVQQRHFQLVRVGLRRRQLRAEIDAQVDGRTERRTDQADHAFHKPGYLDRDGLERLAPRKGEQALDQGFGALGRLQRTIDQPPLALAADPAPDQHVEAADDRCQQIVEVVRHPAGELAHRLHLLALAQRLLRGGELGLAPFVGRDIAPGGVGHIDRRRRYPRNPARGAILVAVPVDDARSPAFSRQLIGFHGRCMILRQDEFVDVVADQFVSCVAQQRRPGRD
jgi:hypothetical protein